MDIRPATNDDVEEIEAIGIENWQLAYRGMIADEILDSLKPNFDSRREQLADEKNHGYVALENSKIIGWGVVAESTDVDLDEPACEIVACYIKPSHWRLGLGKKLCEHMVSLIDKNIFEDLVVWTLKESMQSVGFYQAQGFEPENKDQIHSSGATITRLRKKL